MERVRVTPDSKYISIIYSILSSFLPFFLRGVFCVSAEEDQSHGLFSPLFSWSSFFPCVLAACLEGCELTDFGQCLHQDFRQFWFCRKSSSVSCLLHPGLGSGDQTGSTCTYLLISVLSVFLHSLFSFFFLSLWALTAPWALQEWLLQRYLCFL